MHKKKLVIICLLVFNFTFGCKKSEPSKVEEPSTTISVNAEAAAKTQNGSFQKALDLSMQNKDEEAANEFVKVDWSKADIFSSDSPFSWTENQIRAIAEPQRSQMITETLNAQKPLRKLCRYIIDSTSDSKMDKKEYEVSEQKLQAVNKCGKALTKPEAMLINRMVGLAIQKLALEKLAKLYSANEPARAPEIQAELEQLPKQ